MKMNKLGFTLMEMMVVVVLIAILATIGFPYYLNNVEKQKAISALGIVADIARAQERYYNLHDGYAQDLGKLDLDYPQDMLSGNNYITKHFKFYLNNRGTQDAWGSVVVAERNDSSYYIQKSLETGAIGCVKNGDQDFCEDILNISEKGPTI